MTIQLLRNRFEQLMLATGHEPLPELSLVTPNEETFFTMAAAKGVTEFLRETLPPTAPNMFVIQRMFSGNQTEFAGKYPVSTPLEVQMSVFRFQDKTPETIFQVTLDFLEKEIGLSRNDLYFLAPNEYGIMETLEHLQFPMHNVVTWKKPLAYKLGEEGPFGHYGRFFLNYRHGVFPIADLTFIRSKDEEHLFVESCLYLDRLYFVWSGQKTWFETPLYSELLQQLLPSQEQAPDGSTECSAVVLFRALVALLGDGLEISAKGPGYVARKLIRQIITDWWTTHHSAPELVKWVAPTICGLQFLGYDFAGKQQHIEQIVEAEEAEFLNVLKKAETFVSGQLKKWPVDAEQGVVLLQNWKDSRGIPEVVALHVLDQAGIDTAAVKTLMEQPERFYLKMAGYPFTEEDPILDPSTWLAESEERRYATRKK